MRGGIWVLAVFAAIWGTAGIVVGNWASWLIVVPGLISAGLLLWGRDQAAGIGNPVNDSHVGRVVGIASAIEGIAIFLVANVLINLHQQTMLMPAIAVIVGLHFLPLARWIPVPLYYLTGGVLIAIGLVALLLPPLDRSLITGLAAAVTLWASLVLLIRRERGEADDLSPEA